MLLFAEVVSESFPGGGAISVVRDGVSLGSVIAMVCSWPESVDPVGRPGGHPQLVLRYLFCDHTTAR